MLTEYDHRGRILDGTREQMAETAYQRWLADHLSGKSSVLLVATNVQASELARRARDELAALGMVASDDLVELRDGNVAGVGDLIVARQNDRIQAGEPGRRLANRDVLRIDAWDEIGEARVALVRRLTGHNQRTGEAEWSATFELPAEYIEQHADLAYAGNVHVDEGRTVGTGHLVVDETVGRESFYVGMSRGRERNTAYVITERTRAADLSPDAGPAPGLEDPQHMMTRHHPRTGSPYWPAYWNASSASRPPPRRCGRNWNGPRAWPRWPRSGRTSPARTRCASTSAPCSPCWDQPSGSNTNKTPSAAR